MDSCIRQAKDYDDFLRLMQKNGYEIKQGKYTSFRAAGQQRFTRGKTLGTEYTEERIRERIAGSQKRGFTVRKESELIRQHETVRANLEQFIRPEPEKDRGKEKESSIQI